MEKIHFLFPSQPTPIPCSLAFFCITTLPFLSLYYPSIAFPLPFLAFTHLPFGIYHQLHYASVTNSYSFLDLYPLNPALAAALGDISHLLNSLGKKNAVCPLMWNIQNCNNITIATFCCTETVWCDCPCQHVHSSSPPQQSSIPCLSHVSYLGYSQSRNTVKKVQYTANKMWTYPACSQTEDNCNQVLFSSKSRWLLTIKAHLQRTSTGGWQPLLKGAWGETQEAADARWERANNQTLWSQAAESGLQERP